MFAGTPVTAVPSLQTLLAAGRHEVLAVLTRPDAPVGRGRRLTRSPVAEVADAAGIPVFTPAKPGEPEFLERLADLEPDCCPVVAYGALLPRRSLDVPTVGWVNLHFSLLPAWRGAAPVQAAIRHGDEITGASTFLIEEGMDTGPVFGTVTETIRPDDTAGVLLERLAVAGAGLLEATLDAIEDGTAGPVPQPEHGVSYAPKIKPEDAFIDFGLPAFAVDRLIRAVTPDPGARARFRGEVLGLGPVRTSDVDDLPAGEIRAEKRRVLVGTATNAIELGEVRPPGRKAVNAADWARGSRIEAGENLT